MTTVQLKTRLMPDRCYLRRKMLPNEHEEVLGKEIINQLIEKNQLPPNTYVVAVKIEVHCDTFEEVKDDTE